MIIDAQHQIFAANAAQTMLLERVRELEGQLARMNDWEAQKQRYKLATPFAGCMVYALQKSVSHGQPAHYLCASCFQKGQPSILQGKQIGGMRNAIYCCPICKSEAASQYRNVSPPQYFEDIKPQ